MPHFLIVALATFVTKEVVSKVDEHINKGKTPKKACDSYSWDPVSAGKKLGSGTTVTVGAKVKGGPVGVNISLSKKLPDTGSKDAYRNCKNCGNHYNYHKKNVPETGFHAALKN